MCAGIGQGTAVITAQVPSLIFATHITKKGTIAVNVRIEGNLKLVAYKLRKMPMQSIRQINLVVLVNAKKNVVEGAVNRRKVTILVDSGSLSIYN